MQEKNRKYSILKQRLFEYLDFKGISKVQCYVDTGFSNGILSQTSDFSGAAIITILSVYKDLSPDWWFHEKGEMIRLTNSVEIEHSQFSDIKLIDKTNEKLMLLVLEKDKRIKALEANIKDKNELIEMKNEKLANLDEKIKSLEDEKKASYSTSFAAEPKHELKTKK